MNGFCIDNIPNSVSRVLCEQAEGHLATPFADVYYAALSDARFERKALSLAGQN